jgi:uncharacterized protein (TIGR00369 family)
MPMNDDELLERMNRRVPPTSALLGMKLHEVDSAAGRVKMTFEAKPEFCNPAGNVQGGFVVAMLDDAAALACIVAAGERVYVPTIELKTSFFAPAKAGVPLHVEGRCLKYGKRIAFAEADMTDASGKLLARLSTSVAPMVLETAHQLVERPA